MSEAIEHADELRQQAIQVLLTERTAIDEQLRKLAYDGTQSETTTKKNKVCSRCGSADHNARTCKRNPAENGGANTTPSET